MENSDKRRLSPQPDPSWKVVEESISGMWLFDNLPFVVENYPLGISLQPNNGSPHSVSQLRTYSFYADDNRLMRYEIWRIHKYDKEYERLAYEGVYDYGETTAVQTYWDSYIQTTVNVEHTLDEKGFLVSDIALKSPSYNLGFGHAIVANYKPDSLWKRIEEPWVLEDGQSKHMNVKYLSQTNELCRFERWLCGDDGKPYMLMREEQMEVKGGSERLWRMNKGGFIVEGTKEPHYLMPDGKEIPEKKNNMPIWIIILIMLGCGIAALGIFML